MRTVPARWQEHGSLLLPKTGWRPSRSNEEIALIDFTAPVNKELGKLQLYRKRATLGCGVALGWGIFLAVCSGLSGCDLTPSRPEAVFALYRDRMKSSNLQDARAMLSDESRKLVTVLSEEHKLKEPPENLAILNVLDPVSGPTVVKTTDTLAMLNVRTLKGGTRLIRLTRKDPGAPWRIDISEELSALRSFLNAQKALDAMREQAGEYASSWKAFSDRIKKNQAPEQSRVGAESPKDGSPKQTPKDDAKPKRDIKQEQKRR